MTGAQRTIVSNAATAAAMTVLLSGCNTLDRLSEVGDAPKLTTIENPTTQPAYRPVSMPMPAPILADRQPSSLWRAGARAFLKDQRASDVGDIVTVVIQIDDKAKIDNTTKRTRNNTESASGSALLGYETKLKDIFPEAIDPTKLIDTNSQTGNEGTGSVDRKEQITLKIAAVITQVLPNGNLVLQGRQETRVNFEVRDLQLAGIIRPEDITSTNTIRFDQIAEARIAYGGRGQITDVQQPRYGQQIFDVLFPF
ncbi:MAG: flagellar basal body L-ring protein FlgH [Alphaproteobacteria bacterium]